MNASLLNVTVLMEGRRDGGRLLIPLALLTTSFLLNTFGTLCLCKHQGISPTHVIQRPIFNRPKSYKKLHPVTYEPVTMSIVKMKNRKSNINSKSFIKSNDKDMTKISIVPNASYH